MARIFVIATFSLNSVTFTLGIVETSVSVVLTAVATMPVFAAILSAFLLQEQQGWLGWVAIFTAMAGVGIVVADGSNAIGQPGGSVMLGALYGVLTAIGLAVTFTFARKYPWLAILPAAAFGAFISGMIGLFLAEQDKIFEVPLWTVLTMGLVLLPVSFTCLIWRRAIPAPRLSVWSCYWKWWLGHSGLDWHRRAPLGDNDGRHRGGISGTWLHIIRTMVCRQPNKHRLDIISNKWRHNA